MSFITGIMASIDVIEEEIPEFRFLKKAPKRLWYKGRKELLGRPKVSIVGTRRPSLYTQEWTRRIAAELSSRGVVIVSGAAMGVDALAHQGAGPQQTIAVVATGVDLRYPAVNAELIETIEQKGLVLSQFEPGSRAGNWSFVVRNELVVALGEVLVITEADAKSGSMRSAEYALKQGKEIWVLPHRLGESEGTRRLLKEGLARPIYDLDTFAERFGVVAVRMEDRDEFFYFCQKTPTLDEAVGLYGDRIYEAELEGKIVIENGRIRPA